MDLLDIKQINILALSEEDSAYLSDHHIDVKSIKEAFSLEENHEIYNESNLKNHRRFNARIANAILFHKDIVDKKTVKFASPYSGDLLQAVASYAPQLHKFHCYSYEFHEDNKVFYVILGDYWSEVLAYYIPEINAILSCFNVEGKVIPFLEIFEEHLAANRLRLNKYVKSPFEKTAVLIYHSHFAHHMLNELSALQNLYESGKYDKIDTIFVCQEPLGNMDFIFPELKNKFVRLDIGHALNKVFKENYLIIPLKDCQIQKGLIDRVLLNSERQLTLNNHNFTDFYTTKNRKGPVIWLSIRVKGRTWSNLIDGYANIIKTLLKDYPNLTIVFDGFSIPPNSRKFGTSNYTDLIQAEHDVVNEIVRKVNVKFNFCNIIGQSLDVSFFWTQLVDLYITHHGTIQHKIGWFTTELGIIHTNKLITMKPEKSHQGSFDRKDARIPLYLQPHLITDIDEMVKTRSGQLKNGENRNYNFDWKEIIKLINSNFKF